MPTRSGIKSSAPSGVVEAAQNVTQPKGVEPTPTKTVNTIYARPTGSDSTGNGTLGNPYATFVRALQDVPLHIFSDERYVVDITGITEELDGFNFPPITAQTDLPEFDVVQPLWDGLYAALHIKAEPTATHTIAGGEISSQDADSNTGMMTVVTTNSYTPDELKGKLIIGSGVMEWGMISGNTATDIEHTSDEAFTAPITLYDPGATIKNANPLSYNAPIRLVHMGIAVSFAGISLEHDSGSLYRDSLSIFNEGEVLVVGCKCEGIGNAMAYLQGWWCHFRNKAIGAGWSSWGYNVYDSVRTFGSSGSSNPVGEIEFFKSRFLGCGPAGGVGTGLLATSRYGVGTHIEILYCEIRNALNDGIVKKSGTLTVGDTNIKDSAGHAIRTLGTAIVQLTSVKGTGNAGGLFIGEGGQITKDADTDIHGDGVVTIYARTSGNDDTGDGTLANPYATFVRAMKDVPLNQAADEQYVVDITGLTEEVNGFEMPAFQPASRGFEFDLTGTDITGIKGAVTIYAEPQTEATIASGEISAQNADSNTGMYTVVTTNSYTPDEFKGMFIAGSGPWEWAIISGNTATDIETTADTTFTAPITIMSPGATLQNSTNFDPVIRQFVGDMAITGIHFKQTYHAAARGYEAVWGKHFNWMNACWFDGFEHRDGTIAPNFCYFTKRVWSGGPWFGPYHCVFDTATFTPMRSASPSGLIGFLNCYFLGCDSAGTAQNDEVEISPGLQLQLDKCQVRNATKAGVFLSGGSLTMNNTNIEGSTEAAVRIIRNAIVWLDSVKGSGNTGGGLLVEDGAQVIVNAATDVNAGEAPEVTVGANAAVTWATFRSSGPPYNEVDATVQLARLVQRT